MKANCCLVRPVNDEEVLCDLDTHMQGYGNGKRLAEKLGLDPAYLRSMRAGAQGLSQRVAHALGWDLRWIKRPASPTRGAPMVQTESNEPRV